ncbi:MAG: hypothetical protein M1823_002606 [Watsoniomyces obsoletus]|nr:MAG: hypothetical protein M1823_002606 [Watsoniomyces obsoletus]
MTNPTAHGFPRPTTRKRPVSSRASTPRYSSHQTRQQTLTQIDFVTRFAPEEHVELEFEEVMGPPKTKRRRTSAKQKPPLQNIYDEELGTTSIVNTRFRTTTVPNSDDVDTENGMVQLYSTGKKSGRLEIPSSQTPTKSRIAKYPKEDPSPLKDTSINLPDARSTNSRRRRWSGQQPRLEVGDSFLSDKGGRDVSHKLPIFRSIGTRPSSEAGVLGGNEGSETGLSRDVEGPLKSRAHQVPVDERNGAQPGGKEETQREQISTPTSRVLEIQDSEAELSDEDEDGEWKPDMGGQDDEDRDQDDEPETQLPSPRSRRVQGAVRGSDEESSTKSDDEIGVKPPAIVDVVDLSSGMSNRHEQPPTSGTGLVKEKEILDQPPALEPENLPSMYADVDNNEEQRKVDNSMPDPGPPSPINQLPAIADFTSSPPPDGDGVTTNPAEIQSRAISDPSDNATAPPRPIQTPNRRPQVACPPSTQSTASLPPTPSTTRASTMAVAVMRDLQSSLINPNTCTATQLLPESLMESFLPMPPLTQAMVKEEEEDDDNDDEL